MDHYTQTQAAAGEDHESASRMLEEEPAEVPAKSGWIVDEVRIRQAKNGGWIVTSSRHKPRNNKTPGDYESNDYTFDALAEAVPFIEQEFGASAEGGTTATQAAVPARGIA